MLDVSQSAQSDNDSRSAFDGRSDSDACDGCPAFDNRNVRYPLEYPLEHPLEYRKEYSIMDQVFEGLGASAPVGAGADESASLRLIKTGRLPICKRRAPYFKQVIHIEWLIPT